MNDCFHFRQIGGLKSLVHKTLFDEGFIHGFVTDELNVKDAELSRRFELAEVGWLSLSKQTHSTKVLNCSQIDSEGDAFIVKEGELAGVRTADCVPLILVNTKNQEIGSVIHAGWQGACAGIVQNALNILSEQGYAPTDFVALIGPCALSCCYEVQLDVSSKFSSGVSIREGRTYLSVSEYVRDILLTAGVADGNIHMAEICTICSDSFFSHRRDNERAGRFLSFLALNK